MSKLDDALLTPKTMAQEVCAVALPGEVSVRAAWVTASASREQVHLGVVDHGARLRETDSWSGIMPCMAPLGRGVALLFLAGPDLVPVVSVDEAEPVPLKHQGQCHNPSLAGGDGGAWVGWCEREGRRAFVRFGALAPDGQFSSVARLPGEGCAVAVGDGGARALWVDAGVVLSARLARDGMGDPEVVRADAGAEAAALCAAPGGGWFAGWQGPTPGGVLRWPRVARLAGGQWLEMDPPMPVEDMHLQRAEAGEDQGWERPTLLAPEPGRLWLAGRSAQGFRAQLFDGERWTRRLDISQVGWSGRSRSMALYRFEGETLLLRGTAKGLGVVGLQAESDADAAAEAEAAAAAPAPGGFPPSSPSTSMFGSMPLFGDIHQHTMESDGLGTVEDAYRRAREVYGFDFVAITDHDGLAGGCLGPLSWKRQCRLADSFDEPGRFVTLRGFEFTGSRQPGRGHKCVYFDDEVPEQLPGRDPDRLDELLARHPSLSAPHHTAWTGADMDHHDPAQQPVWEVCSVHGAYEHGGDQVIPPRPDVILPGQFIRDALDAGLRFGLVGGTDNHGLRWHHGVGHKADPQLCGLTAVYCEPTRESLLAALRARRCYATSGARILLRVELDGAPMGSEVPAGSPGALEVEVRGTAGLRRVSVLVDGEEQAFVTPDSQDATLRHTIAGARERSRYVLVTVLQQDGEMAWSSPIWIGP